MTGKGKGVALVTGAGERIGKALAMATFRHGYAVAVHYHRSDEAAAALVAEIEAAGGRAQAFAADLGDESESAGLVEAAASLGPVTCLVNNASAFEYDSAASASRASWDAHMEVNLRAPLVLSQSFAAALPDDREGVIVNMLDQRVANLTPHFLSYTVSKSALWTLTQTLAMALAPRIRVMGIGPGPTLPSARQDEAAFAKQVAATPLARAVSVDEICGALRFILDAPSLTGQMIALDSGQHLGWRNAPTSDADLE